ncbi:MAG: hypothetical protein JXB19_08310 [Bacteroidales bacterium]|nr:hypothetical protein [Bacteroidales bacterium]
MQKHFYLPDFGTLKHLLWPVLLTCIVINLACAHEDTGVSSGDEAVPADTVFGTIVADTITYEVIIRNSNPDDRWAEQCLSNLNHQALISNIFRMIREGNAYAYEYETMERLTNRQLEKIESETGFDYNEIGMIQFTEIWFLNPDKSTMTKKVHSMVLGYNFYTSDGEHFGYKPLFRVELKS